MNALKEKILKLTADLLLGKEARPSNGSVSKVKSLEQCVAFVLESREGLKPVHVVTCHLKNQEREIFPEVVWDLLCARVIVPTGEGNGLDKIRPHSDAEDNWSKFKVTEGVSG
jgi:hypothetical protein